MCVCVCRSRSLRGWRPSTTVQLTTQTSWRSARGRWLWWRGRRTASGGWVSLVCFILVSARSESEFCCGRRRLDVAVCLQFVIVVSAVTDRSHWRRADQTRSVSCHLRSLHHRVRRQSHAFIPFSSCGLTLLSLRGNIQDQRLNYCSTVLLDPLHSVRSQILVWAELCRILFVAPSLQTPCFCPCYV